MQERTFPRTCPVCGHSWQAQGNRAVYCSIACRVWKASHPGVPRARVNVCATCGVLTKSRRFIYCSPACRPTSRPGRRGPTAPLSTRVRDATCEYCETTFTTTKTLQRFCSERCLNRSYNHDAPRVPIEGRVCAYCGGGISSALRLDARFCRSTCQVQHNQMARRARRRGLPAENIDRAAVFERDRWVCHICLEPVDRILRGRHPFSASIDHVIPLADPISPGHVWGNVALAHLRCNISKGAGYLVGR